MKIPLLLLFGCFAAGGSVFAAGELDNELAAIPIEIAVIEPAEIQYVSLWVPAVKSGPFINRSCRVQQNLTNASELPATIDHQKDPNCPPEPARILAELASGYQEKMLPLTIFNGWQWEYNFSLCQYEKDNYALPDHGGCWENCHEAILSMTIGKIACCWMTASPLQLDLLGKSDMTSTILIHTFSSMRTRDGYPKERNL